MTNKKAQFVTFMDLLSDSSIQKPVFTDFDDLAILTTLSDAKS